MNGVEQHEGSDYVVAGDRLMFDRSLAQEGRLGFWRWLLIFLGIAGTYRKHETVDVQYSSGGKPKVASGLHVEPLDKSAPHD